MQLRPKSKLKKLDITLSNHVSSDESTYCGSFSTDENDNTKNNDEDDDDDALHYYPSSTTSSSSLPNISSIESEDIICDFDPDYYLPKGILTITSHKMLIGTFGKMKIGLFRNKYKIMLKSYKFLSKNIDLKRTIVHELNLFKRIGYHPKIHQLYGYLWTESSSDYHRSNSNSSSNHSNSSSSGLESSSSSSSSSSSLLAPLQLQMIYELPAYGTLINILQEKETIPNIPISLCIAWLSDLTEAMSFLHSKGIVHGTITAENILVYERLDIKICNFTTAKTITTDHHYETPFITDTMIGRKKEFAPDYHGLLHTTLQILTRQDTMTLIEEQQYIQEQEQEVNHNYQYNIEDYCKKIFYQLPITEFSIGLKLYDILYPILLFPYQLQSLSSKQLAMNLLLLLEDCYDGDPRDRSNDYSLSIKRLELLIMASTKNIHHLIQLSPRVSLHSQMLLKKMITALQKHTQKYANNGNNNNNNSNKKKKEGGIGGGGGGGSPRSHLHHSSAMLDDNDFPNIDSIEDSEENDEHHRNNYIPDESTILLQTEQVIDPRKFLVTWIEYECNCPSAVAEELSLLLLVNGILSPKHLSEKLKMNPFFLKCLSFEDSCNIIPKLTKCMNDMSK